MSKTTTSLLATRSWIVHIDDERSSGNSIIATLASDYDFADNPGCGVKGFDTRAEVKAGTRKSEVVQSKTVSTT